MRPITTLLLVLLLVIFVPAANACKNKNRIVEFGNGGGFTGKYNDYKLDSKGVLYVKKDSVNYDKIKTLDKAQVADFFKSTTALQAADWAVSDPGNMTYYIKYSDAKAKHTAKWGGTTTQPSATLKALYDKLILATAKDKS